MAAALVSCSPGSAPSLSSSNATPAQASDLRIQLDLLLTEHVVIVAKESAAALNSSSEFRAYATLLTTNESALTQLVRRAVGNTTADAFAVHWRALNADLVDYAIQVATHDGDKADADTSRLTDSTMPDLADQLADITLGQAQPMLAIVTKDVTAIRDTIDGEANHQYTAMYTNLETAVSAATTLGDAVAAGVVRRFADRFPGDHASDDVARRVRLNVLLQERAYLETMATDAQLNSRPDERTQALHALSSNLDFLYAELHDSGLRQLWADQATSIQLYASSGDDASKRALSDTFVRRLVATTNVSTSVASNQVDATIRVIDDQREKDTGDIANDDRAAATAMQPIADSL